MTVPDPQQPREPTQAEYREAYRIHRCPPGYKGPCWGPNPEDFEQARRNLIERESTE